ncbi:MAG: hypothetical protein MUF43_08405, partial [Flavobacterium sp.]|nr:hypothetical protein [Flavobacterium sp.]
SNEPKISEYYKFSCLKNLHFGNLDVQWEDLSLPNLPQFKSCRGLDYRKYKDLYEFKILVSEEDSEVEFWNMSNEYLTIETKFYQYVIKNNKIHYKAPDLYNFYYPHSDAEEDKLRQEIAKDLEQEKVPNWVTERMKTIENTAAKQWETIIFQWRVDFGPWCIWLTIPMAFIFIYIVLEFYL